jgi:hypothetical protein
MHFLSHSLSFLDNVICIGKGLYVVKPKFSKNKTPDLVMLENWEGLSCAYDTEEQLQGLVRRPFTIEFKGDMYKIGQQQPEEPRRVIRRAEEPQRVIIFSNLMLPKLLSEK